jgi:hypothetical protein
VTFAELFLGEWVTFLSNAQPKIKPTKTAPTATNEAPTDGLFAIFKA